MFALSCVGPCALRLGGQAGRLGLMSILVRAAEREDMPALVRLRLANAERHAAFAGLFGMEAIAYAWDLN